MGILPSNAPISRKHHVSSWPQVEAYSRIAKTGKKLNFISDYSSIVHRSETHRKASKGRLNCSEGKGHTFESCRVRQFFLVYNAICRPSLRLQFCFLRTSKQLGENLRLRQIERDNVNPAICA